MIGSFIAFVPLLVWNAIALGLSAQVDQSVDPLELLLRSHPQLLSALHYASFHLNIASHSIF